MSKKANQTGRKKGSNKKKETEKKYGKFSKRSIRITQNQLVNEEKNKKLKEAKLLEKETFNNKRKKNFVFGKKVRKKIKIEKVSICI